jgi:altronate dehydratase
MKSRQAIDAPLEFAEIGRLPLAADNVAIATRNLEAGARFAFAGRAYALSHSVLEGHRFTVCAVAEGSPLLSWGLPFGVAMRAITPGEYVCNQNVLDALQLRKPDFALPDAPNFTDQPHGYRLDEQAFEPGTQVGSVPEPGEFLGYPRTGSRGSGTRNYIVILGTTSRTASLARTLADRLTGAASGYASIDGIVPVAHTEGAEGDSPNNRALVLRTLAGFMVHPNVGAVLALDHGTESVTNAMLEQWMKEHQYPLGQVRHRFHTVEHDFETSLAECAAVVRAWLDPVNRERREPRPLAELRIALQCGGSDAFSGVSGNPLAGWVAREVIRHGGAAGLAETDELIGAEPYILANTRDLKTARAFLDRIEAFRERIAWHGHNAEGNPTGGNLYRGLYNISLKSIGAARKKDPDVRLDYVIGYGERMSAPGFYFMDSPGNDLESIAGQVASGCNLVFFITGNGSITNFPFVPTVKFVTTTRRWNLLESDMDINAGRYLDGTPMDELGSEAFRYSVDVAAGMPSVGERAGHTQVSIWRNWQQSAPAPLAEWRHRPVPSGNPIEIRPGELPPARFSAVKTARGHAIRRVGLVMPTSLCSGQIAGLIARKLNERFLPGAPGLATFVALPHTEGCGASGGDNEAHYLRTVTGHLLHPLVAHALLLEHGCEKTHNDLMRHTLERQGVDPDRFGYASIQLDGGIERVTERVQEWFAKRLQDAPAEESRVVGLEALAVGVLSTGQANCDADPIAERALARLTAGLVGRGGCVVVPENCTLMRSTAFLDELGLAERPKPTLDYAQIARIPGFHVMATPTGHPVEMLTGLGATGVQLILAHVDGPPLQGHPMVATLQMATAAKSGPFAADRDYLVPASGAAPADVCRALVRLLRDTAAGTYSPGLWQAGNTDFQVTRGALGVSL